MPDSLTDNLTAPDSLTARAQTERGRTRTVHRVTDTSSLENVYNPFLVSTAPLAGHGRTSAPPPPQVKGRGRGQGEARAGGIRGDETKSERKNPRTWFGLYRLYRGDLYADCSYLHLSPHTSYYQRQPAPLTLLPGSRLDRPRRRRASHRVSHATLGSRSECDIGELYLMSLQRRHAAVS